MAELHKTTIPTSIGLIVVHNFNPQADGIPIFLLHGVYFDHKLWAAQLPALANYPVYAIDMPMHGESKNGVKKHWTLEDCAQMLIDILDFLGINRVIAVGHSWGSMTILRAAVKFPERFVSVGLCNMPFKAPTLAEKIIIHLQHTAIIFRQLYMKQAAKALMSKESLKKNPSLVDHLIRSMSKLSIAEIIHTDKAVRLDAADATVLIGMLKVPTMALVGEHDYVGLPPIKDAKVVQGGHVSPLEAPDEVSNLINRLLEFIDA